MSLLLSTSHDGQSVVIRDIRADDVVPDLSSRWDDWPHDVLADDERTPINRAVICIDDTIVGTMSWHPVFYGPSHGSRAWSIGIALSPDRRGRGLGATCQRLLADHLLGGSHRVEALTDVDNTVEQRSLSKAGFQREGILRAAQHRADGLHHDLVVYALVRSPAPGGAASTA